MKKHVSKLLCICMILCMIPTVKVEASSVNLTFTDYEPVINQVVNEESGFTHPSIGVTSNELENVRTQIKNNVEPWSSYLEGMLTTKYASKNYSIRNQNSSDPTKSNYTYKDYTSSFMENIIQEDGKAAYIQSLLYYFTGDEDYREKAITILRLWSQLDPSEAGNVSDGRIKMSGPMYYMVSAAEILKYTSCQNEDLIWTKEDNDNFITNFVKPPLKYYLANDDANNYRMNQYNYSLLARISTDIFMDDVDDYNIAVEMATVNSNASDAGGNGSLSRVIRRLSDDGNIENIDDDVIQLAEMGRDQPHAAANLYGLSTIAYMLEGQGTQVDPETGEVSTEDDAVSMFNFLDNRLLKGINYFLKYNLGYETTWYPLVTSGNLEDGKITNITSTYDVIYDQGRGNFYNFSLLYYYYKYNPETSDLMDDENGGKYLTEIQSLLHSPESGDYSSAEGFDFWLHIPMQEANIKATGVGSNDSYEVEDKYVLLNGSATKESDNNTSYVNLLADNEGTDISLLKVPTVRDRSGYSVITLKIKTTSNATLYLRRDNNSEPFTTITLPNTNNEWTDIVINMNVDEVSYAEYSQDIQILYLSVTDEDSSYVGIDTLKINSKDNYAPEFENDINEKTIDTYINSNLSISFKATDKENDTLTYTCINAPDGANLNSLDGTFNWTPKESGTYEFFVQVTDNKATKILKVTINVASDIKETLNQILKSYDSEENYVSTTKKKFDEAYAKVQELIKNNEEDSDIVNNALNNLQEAINSLELLTPLLEDGSINYSNIVTSSLSDSKEKNLLDGDTETFTGDLFKPNNYFTFDFGKDYVITADSFKIQARKYFSGRIWGAVVYGSNDGINWTTLTTTDVRDTAEMVELPVIEKYKNVSFRYLKIGSNASCFNPSEFRIIGNRHETTNRISSVSISSSNESSKRAVPGDKITLTFTAKDEIKNIKVLIDNQEAQINEIDNLTYTAEIILDDENLTIGDANFEITYNTSDDKEGMIATQVTDDSSVLLSDDTNSIDVLDGNVDFIDSTVNRSIEDTLKIVKYLFDNKDTCSDFRSSNASYGAYITFDFKDNIVNLSRIEVLARQDGYYSRINGLTILGSNDNENWTNLSTDSVSSTKKWQILNINDNNSYRYIKITNPNNWYGNMAELRLYK